MRLLRRWIRRLIFILILFILAFLIYWIFNPSWAGRLWYNIRTFPTRIASWISSGTEFLDYDNYKLNIPSVWEKLDIWYSNDDLEILDNDDNELENDLENDIQPTENQSLENNNENTETRNRDSQTDKTPTIKAFPKSIKFIKMPWLNEKDKNENDEHEDEKQEDDELLTWYSKTDLLWIINKYIEKNLDDDTDILVTVEYEDENSSPNKIILNTQPKK